MSKVKRKWKQLISLFLVLVMSITTSTMIVHATLLPLEERNAYLVLKDYTDEQIKNMPVSTVLSLMQDSDGNKIEIPADAEIVWTYFKDEKGNTLLQDEYHVISRDETIDLSYFKETKGYTMELIVGSGTQLNPENIRYLVDVYFESYDNTISFDLYTQSSNGTREKVEPKHKIITYGTYDKITDINGNPISMVNFFFEVPEGNYVEPYLSMAATIDKRPDVDVEVYELGDFNLQNPITDQILYPDMEEKDAGYKMQGADAGFILVYYIDGIQADVNVATFHFTGSLVHVSGDLSFLDNSSKTSVVNSENEIVDLNSDIYTLEYELKEGYTLSSEYVLNFNATNGSMNLNDKVVKAVVGHYDTLDEAATQPDIKDELFSNNSGYKARFDGEGVDFTLFFENGAIEETNVYKLTVKAIEYKEVVQDFDNAPIVGAKDPWFRVDGMKSGSSSSDLDTYVVENGKEINMDTMYGYGYQTILINDKNVDLSQLKPTFFVADNEKIIPYATSETEGDKQISGESIRDFSNGDKPYGTRQYSTVINDSNGKHTKNYQVTVAKKVNGPKLFVSGPSTRTVFLDEYFEEKHDILIANIGDQPLTGLKVKLDATNVKLDDYWTVGGNGNDTLAAFTETSSDTEYGELANIAKIRLLPNGEGEIKGTLTISADGQEDVVINLTGRAKNPSIITKQLDEGVKFVPYSFLVATDNMNDWNDVTFELVDGKLPEGVALIEETGEIYGVPQETGTFDFRIKATYSRDDYFEPSYADLSLTVKDNTNENVYLSSDSDEGYGIEKPLGTETGEYEFVLNNLDDTEFISNGELDTFVALWLNGEKLEPGEDYTTEEGSTKITIKGQTLENQANPDDANTIAMEFRDKDDNELHRTAQNFEMDLHAKVNEVIRKIDSLPDVDHLTLADKDDVQGARNAYNSLSKEEQAQVTNYNKLTALEAQMIDLEAAYNVATQINNLPSTIKLSDRAAVENARKVYDALTPAQKELVTNYDRLQRAEKAIQQLEAIEKDKQAASKVVALIDNLPNPITLESESAIKEARAAYNQLTSNQKTYVTNYSVLQAAEEKLTHLKIEIGDTSFVTFVGILEDKNGNGVSNYTVEIHSNYQSGMTDENGSFQFNGVEFGNHTIIVKDVNGKVVAQKDFSLVSGTPLALNGDEIIAESGSVFTLHIQLAGNSLTFLSVEAGNKAPIIDTDHDDDSDGIYIGEDEDITNITGDSPETGDHTNLVLWTSMLVVSLAGIAVTGGIKLRKKIRGKKSN